MNEKMSGETLEDTIQNCKETVLADFYSDSCAPCRRIAAVLEEIEKEYSGKIKVIKINVGENIDTAMDHGISATPTLIFFTNGEERKRVIGAVNKSVITDTIDSLSA